MSFFERFIPNNVGRKKYDAEVRKQQVYEMIEKLLENERSDQKLYPEECKGWQPFLTSLRGRLEKYQDVYGAVDASAQFFITEDKMTAYACILPPLGGGKELKLEAFEKALEKSGVSVGINNELACKFVAKRNYLHIFPIAKGTPSTDGTDGRREDLFEPMPVFKTEGHDGVPIDFSVMRPVQLIRKGGTVSRIYPPTPGKEGVDVTGQKIPCYNGVPAEIRLGHNTQLSEDGLRVETIENGGVFEKDGVMYVQTAIVRTGGLKADDELVWLAYIDGDIPEGIKVESTSNVVVMGEIRGADIHTSGSVRAQGGIRKGSHIVAKHQVLAPVIEESYVRAGRDIYAEEIRDSEVSSNGSVFITGGKGLIQGGTVRARYRLECKQIGIEEGGRNEVILGYSDELGEEISELTDEMEDVQSTLDKLRKNILNLRMGGERLSPEKRELLDQLVEQKDLYAERAAEISAQLKEAKGRRREGLDSEARCEKMYPFTTISIGGHTGKFAYPETNCRIHLYAGQVMTK